MHNGYPKHTLTPGVGAPGDNINVTLIIKGLICMEVYYKHLASKGKPIIDLLF